MEKTFTEYDKKNPTISDIFTLDKKINETKFESVINNLLEFNSICPMYRKIRKDNNSIYRTVFLYLME